MGSVSVKYRKSVFKSLALITQLGVSMLVPIAICVALGVFIDSKFDTYWVIPLLFLGMLAGGRNVYRLAMAASKDDEKGGREDKYAAYGAFLSELKDDDDKKEDE